MFCIKCGKTLDPSATVCPGCGTAVVVPEGFDPHNNTETDIEMLGSEKTVAADYSAIARKAVAASNANTAEEATAVQPVPAVSSVMQDTVPHSPAGFELKNVKKTMNGRSILIDDSPLPGVMPAYLAPPVQAVPAMPQAQSAVAASVNEKPQKKTVTILIIAVAVLSVALVACVLFFIFNGKDKEKEGSEPSTKVAVSEEQTIDNAEKLDKDDFTSDETASGTLVNNYTDIFIDEGIIPGRPELTEMASANGVIGTRPVRPGSPITSGDFIISDESDDKSKQDLSDFINDDTTSAVADNEQEETTAGNEVEATLAYETSTAAENAN